MAFCPIVVNPKKLLMNSVSLELAASGQQELSQGSLVVFTTEQGGKKVEVFWERDSGALRGCILEDGKMESAVISGISIAERRAVKEELPEVRRFFEGAAVRVWEGRIEVWPKLLGGVKPENATTLSVFISCDRNIEASNNEINRFKREIEEKFNKGAHSSVVFKEEPEGASEWQKFIREETQKADLVLLYITKQYLKSDFCPGRIFKAMQVLGDDWAKKMHIVCDSEMQKLLQTRKAWFEYLKECAAFWVQEHNTLENGFKDSLPEVQLALASERESLYRNRIDIPAFIQGIRDRKRSSMEDLKQEIERLVASRESTNVAKPNVFISAHSTSEKGVSQFKERFSDQLDVLDSRPKVGENIHTTIRQKVEAADFVVFFVTKDYLESEDCMCQATMLRSLVLKPLGENVYKQKMHIICDQEIVRLKNDLLKGAVYVNKCCQKWNKRIDKAVKFMADPKADPQVKRQMIGGYLDALCYYREEIVPFIKEDVFAHHWLTLEETIQENFKSLEEKVIPFKKKR